MELNLNHAPLCVNNPNRVTPEHGMTKEQSSELQRLAHRIVDTELALQKALAARVRAQRNLHNFIQRVFPKKEA